MMQLGCSREMVQLPMVRIVSCRRWKVNSRNRKRRRRKEKKKKKKKRKKKKKKKKERKKKQRIEKQILIRRNTDVPDMIWEEQRGKRDGIPAPRIEREVRGRES